MTQQPVTFQQVTVSEAAGILGVSTQTVRRMLRRGQPEGERVHRPQGTAYVVNLPVDGAAGDTDATATQQPAPNVSRSNATDQTAPAEAMVSLIQTTIGTVLGPLIGELAASRQANEQLSSQLVRQAETIGQLRAENRALLASTAAQTPEPTPESHPTDRYGCGSRGGRSWWLQPWRLCSSWRCWRGRGERGGLAYGRLEHDGGRSGAAHRLALAQRPAPLSAPQSPSEAPGAPQPVEPTTRSHLYRSRGCLRAGWSWGWCWLGSSALWSC